MTHRFPRISFRFYRGILGDSLAKPFNFWYSLCCICTDRMLAFAYLGGFALLATYLDTCLFPVDTCLFPGSDVPCITLLSNNVY